MDNNQVVSLAAEQLARGNYSLAEVLLLNQIGQNQISVEIWRLLAHVSRHLGKHGQALYSAYKASSLEPDRHIHSIFVECLPYIQFVEHDTELQMALAKAVSGAWGAPEELNSYACKLLKLDPSVNSLLKIVQSAEYSMVGELLDLPEFTELSRNRLLLNALVSAPICDLEIECLLIQVRKGLLLKGSKAVHYTSLVSAIAQQSFINEYLFKTSTEELVAISDLRQRIIVSPQVEDFLLLACYEQIDGEIINHIETADGFLAQVLKMHVDEPRTEIEHTATISVLSKGKDKTSHEVRKMYEQSPYPRWTRISQSFCKLTFKDYIKQNYPAAVFNDNSPDLTTRILVAGGGTGRHPIQTAQRYLDVDVDVIDLSLKSLAYAKRKSIELCVPNISFSQLDILECERLEKKYDVIECVGVLHHMADPWWAWKKLLGQLECGGLMRLGLYSSTARADVNKIREFIKDQGYASAPDAVRFHRYELIEYARNVGAEDIFRMGDFYTTSSCRDLLFHVQEAQVTIEEIQQFLALNGLRFIGFETGHAIGALYDNTYSDDKFRTNMDHWSEFEKKNPKIFLGMYQFWVQKISN